MTCDSLVSADDHMTCDADDHMTIISNNRALAYFHPGAVSSVPRLVALLLTTNRLSSLEDVQVVNEKHV